MPTLLIYILTGGVVAVGLALLVRLLDFWAGRSIDRHVHRALDLSPGEEEFERHVDEALDVAREIPRQRQPMNDVNGVHR